MGMNFVLGTEDCWPYVLALTLIPGIIQVKRKTVILQASDVGIVVSIAAFQAVDPGSIPGHRNKTFFKKMSLHVNSYQICQ